MPPRLSLTNLASWSEIRNSMMKAVRILALFTCGLYFSCGGSAYGKIGSYPTEYSYGTLQDRVDSLNTVGKLTLVCSPVDRCKYDMYGEFYVVVPPIDGVGDSLQFKFREGSTGGDASEINLITGMMPSDSIMLQAGQMTRVKRKELSNSFEKNFLPLINR